jgi:hypothetical protein
MSHIDEEGRRCSNRTSPYPTVASIEHEINTMLTPIASTTMEAPMTTMSVASSPSTTNDLLSFDKSSTTTTEHNNNTDNQTDQSYKTKQEPPSLPESVSANSPQQDPAITQLQASIRAIASRITTIQEVTESRFESINTDFRRTQTELTEILKEGLTDISKQRMQDIQMLKEQFNPQAQKSSPPPSVTFRGPTPDVLSTTSSLGDPPASCDTVTSSNASMNASSKPDPPEQTTATYAPTTKTKKKENKTTKVAVLSHPTTPSITNPPQQTIIVKTVKDPTPLTFKSFKKETSYSDFKTACLIRTNTDTYHYNLVTKNTEGRLIWNKDVSEKESQTLHLATTTAMGVNATNLICQVNR